MVGQLAPTGIGYEFVEGVDGRDLDLRDAGVVNRAWLGPSPFWPGAVGCALSHLRVYQKVLDEGLDAALVLEDDTLLPTDLLEVATAVAGATSGPEVVLLHYFSAEPRRPCRLSGQGSLKLPTSQLLALPIEISQIGSASAYVVTRKACEQLNAAVVPVRVPADDWAFFCREGVLDRVRCVVPMPVGNHKGFRTTIDHYAAGSLRMRLRELAIKVPLLKDVLTFRRQRLSGLRYQVELVDQPASLARSTTSNGTTI